MKECLKYSGFRGEMNNGLLANVFQGNQQLKKFNLIKI